MGRKILNNPHQCPLVHAVNIVGGKWKPIIIHLLRDKHIRFGKLVVLIPTISRKVLASQLKELEKDGIIIREKFAEVPPRVEYSLSERGEKLLPVLDRLVEWSLESAGEVVFECA